MALVAGEPGVGKTRLAAELAARVHGEGAMVLAGRCDEDLGVPYQPFVEALRHFVDHAPPDEVPERLGRFGAELVRLVPELVQRAVGLPAPLRSDPDVRAGKTVASIAINATGVTLTVRWALQTARREGLASAPSTRTRQVAASLA